RGGRARPDQATAGTCPAAGPGVEALAGGTGAFCGPSVDRSAGSGGVGPRGLPGRDHRTVACAQGGAQGEVVPQVARREEEPADALPPGRAETAPQLLVSEQLEAGRGGLLDGRDKAAALVPADLHRNPADPSG